MYKAQYYDNSKVKTVSFHRILVLLHFNRYSRHSDIYFDDVSNLEIVRHIFIV